MPVCSGLMDCSGMLAGGANTGHQAAQARAEQPRPCSAILAPANTSFRYA